MSSQENQIVDETQRFYLQVPNLIDDSDLSPYAIRLYIHLKRVAGEVGACWQSTRTMAQHCKMSAGSVSKAKKELQDAGYIRIETGHDDARNIDFHLITIVNIWPENSRKYQPEEDTRSPGERYRSYSERPRSPDERPRSPGERPRSPGEPKNNPIKNNPIKNMDSANPKKSKADPRSSHPAIQAIKHITGKMPPKALYEILISDLGASPDEEKLAQVYAAWIGRGYNPRNYAGFMQWFNFGIPPSISRNMKGKPVSHQTPEEPEFSTEELAAQLLGISVEQFRNQ